ncbi:MAG TPA: Ig-like domain-containing protein [Chitinophagales bacterium]|nr:Ig-like domain-containing protein [Chitinophagales bacterium]
MNKIFTYLIFSIFSLLQLNAQSFTCNNALVGQDYVVDRVDPGILSLLEGGNSFNNVLDGDLTNYAQVDMTLVALGASVISVKKVNGNFSAGKKVGFVIEVPSTLLTVDLLDGLSLRTYLDNNIQETVALGGGGGLLKLSVLNSGKEGTKRIEFTTTKSFDEVELIQSSVVAALSSIRIYNAYLSDASCNNDCITTLTTGNYSGASASTATGLLDAKFSNVGSLLDADLNNYSTQPSLLNLGLVGLSSFVQIKSGTTFPAGTDVGFKIQQPGLLGLISLDLLGSMTITTYNSAGVPQETFLSSDLADASLLSDGFANIGFKSTKAFSNIRLSVNAELLDLVPIRVLYGYVRLDSDNDGVPDCLDNCVGNDLLVNSKGEPLACYPECNLNAGADISECPTNSDGSIQLNSAGSGNTWAALAGNPSAATINSAGLVQNMSVEGIYRFRLYNGICSDTISVNYQAGINSSCNRALVGPNVIIDGQGLNGGLLCLLCGEAGANNVVDGDLNNYLEYNQLLGLLASTSLIAVTDTNNVYPAGTRTGYVVSFPDGLLSAALLNQFEIRTYLNGNFVESATSANGLLGVGVLAGAGNKTRIGFITTQPFDKVEIVTGSVLGLLTTIRIHNAFVEDGSCPSLSDVSLNPSSACFEILEADSDNFSTINYDKSGFTGVACALCNLDSLSNIVDNSYTNYATLTLPVGLLVEGSVSVKSKKTYTSGYEAGFAVTADASLLTIDVLSNIAIVTYLDGVKQDSIVGNTGLLNASLLPGSSSIGYLGFRSEKSFNEVRLVASSPVGANLLTDGLKIYYAYARLDSDGDGIPDCLDKCCSGDDNFDADGDGIPDACDVDILAIDDIVTTEENTIININVLDNDELGIHGIDSIVITQQPLHGTAIINDGGTPEDPSDDIVIYTPDSNFIGVDTFFYQICDSFTICSQAMVIVNVEEQLKANNDSITVNDSSPITIDVLENDSFGPEGPGDGPITIVTPPTNGTAVVDDGGTPNDPTDDVIVFTPDSNFNGTDSLVYQICDSENNCETATVYITGNLTNNAPIANDDYATISGGGTIALDVLDNDNDDLDGTMGGLDTNSLKIISAPINGVAIVNNMNGTITYTANNGFIGEDTMYYEICDIGSPVLCDTAMVVYKVGGSPDLTPTITLFPTVITGTAEIDILIDIKEIGNAPTDGSTITVLIGKNSTMILEFDPAQTELIFFDVDNPLWTFDNTNSSYYIFTTTETIPAKGSLSFALSSNFDPSNVNGINPLSVTIFSGGGEVNMLNNSDSDVLKYFAE